MGPLRGGDGELGAGVASLLGYFGSSIKGVGGCDDRAVGEDAEDDGGVEFGVREKGGG